MQRHKEKLLDLKDRFGNALAILVSLDHFMPDRHESERWPGTYKPTLEGLTWLARNGFKASVAGRLRRQFAYFSRRNGAVIGLDVVVEMIKACRDNLVAAEAGSPCFYDGGGCC